MDNTILQRNKLYIRKSRNTNYTKNILASIAVVSDLLMKILPALVIQIGISLALKADERTKRNKNHNRRFASLKRLWRRRSTNAAEEDSLDTKFSHY